MKKKTRLISIVLVFIGLVAGIVFFLLGVFKPKSAGLLIETTPNALVFIDGEQVGRTPYEGTMPPGEIFVKLIPESLESALAPFETKLTLTSGIKTVVKREFGESDEVSAGEIIAFEKTGGRKASLSVVSIPDAAQISVDGAIKGFAPYKVSSIVPGEHQVAVVLPGYKERTTSVKAIEGYRLTLVVKLAVDKEAQPAVQEESGEEIKQKEVEILSTPTGFLRVRSKPSTVGEEIGRVEPGKRYVFLEEDEETGWLKIEYEKGKEGWISNRYAKKVEESEEENL